MFASAALCAMAAPPPKSEAEYLAEARAICRQLGNVFFKAEPRFDPGTRTVVTVYTASRPATRWFAERRSIAELVRLLRRQLPKRRP